MTHLTPFCLAVGHQRHHLALPVGQPEPGEFVRGLARCVFPGCVLRGCGPAGRGARRRPGVTVRGIPQLDGEPGFAEIFLDEVFVPDEDVLGPVGEGWRVAMSTASNERGLSLRSPGRFLASTQRLVDLWRAVDDPADTALGNRVVDAWIGARAYQLHTFATVTRLADGGELGAESSIGKLFWSQLDVSLHETALDLHGARGELAGDWMDGYLFALSGPIYAGTNEIQRNVVAERLLGLPRGDR